MHTHVRLATALAVAGILGPLAAACSTEKPTSPLAPSRTQVVPASPSEQPPQASAVAVAPDEMFDYLVAFSADSPEWRPCADGNADACFRFVWDVAQSVNPTCDPDGWGLLSKNAGEWQCTRDGCGHLDGEGFGEDILTYGGSSPLGIFDVIGGAGSWGSYLWFGDMSLTRRNGNDWACPWE